METYNTNEIISSSLENVTKLREQLSKIEQLREDISKTIELAREVPAHFNRLGGDFSITTTNFINKNEELLREQILNFTNKINDLQGRIEQIDQINFTAKFQESRDAFFTDLNSISQEKLNLFDTPVEALRSTQNDFKTEVSRLKSIDLETHFNRHDKRLSDIFGGINNINSSLLNISNQIIVFQERLAGLEQKSVEINKAIIEQQSALQNEFNAIKSANDLVLKKQKSNFTILMVLIVVAILASVILHLI